MQSRDPEFPNYPLTELATFTGPQLPDWPGDSSKTTIIDAIDFCLGARRNISFADTDFYGLDVTQPISITVTLGSLSDALMRLDSYGNYLQAFNRANGLVTEEPEQGLETVLCLRLTVDSELEPVWSLVSQRAQAQGLERNIAGKIGCC